ncbi:hypothetical protein ACFLYW_01010 [Thermodesulfobacteriota bacterium]
MVSLLLLVALIFWSEKNRHNNKSIINTNILLALFAITPFISLFHTSGLAETLSSLFVTLTLISLYKANESSFKIKSYSYWLTFLFIILAIITKRENYILVIFLFLIPFFRYVFKQKLLPAQYLVLLFLVAIVGISFAFYIRLLGIEFNESGDIGRHTFSLHYLLSNLRQLLLAVFSFSYWGITGIILFGATFYLLFNRNIEKLGLLSISLAILYILLYSSHYRSYYQVKFDFSHPFETLRYSVNYFPLIAIFISTIDYSKLKSILEARLSLRYIRLVSFLMFVLLVWGTINTRTSLSNDEQISRIRPVGETLDIIDTDDIIITDIPIIFHCYVNENQYVVDAFYLTEERLQVVKIINPSSRIYFLKRKDLSIDKERFGIKFDLSKFNRVDFISNKYELLQLGNRL